jgi:hypothetical protein
MGVDDLKAFTKLGLEAPTEHAAAIDPLLVDRIGSRPPPPPRLAFVVVRPDAAVVRPVLKVGPTVG